MLFGKNDWFEIVGTNRETGQREIVYEGNDYSNVNDMMRDDGDSHETYKRMELYENGELIETANCPAPSTGERVFDAVGSLIALLIVIGFIVVMHFR
jgi:hypothetical protein